MEQESRRDVLRTLGAAAAATAGIGTVSAGTTAETNRKLAEIRDATVQYHDVAVAQTDGYILGDHCVAHPTRDAAMGYHAANIGKVGWDLDHTDPQVLAYEKRGGEYHFGAVEYLVASAQAPTFLGHEMHAFIPADNPANPFGETIWELHAWVWKGNPDGTFASFNPNVVCPGRGGRPD